MVLASSFRDYRNTVTLSYTIWMVLLDEHPIHFSSGVVSMSADSIVVRSRRTSVATYCVGWFVNAGVVPFVQSAAMVPVPGKANVPRLIFSTSSSVAVVQTHAALYIVSKI